MIAWPLFAVGGVYAWAGVPLMAAALVLTWVSRPFGASSRDTQTLDRLLLAVVAVAALPLVPVPAAVRAVLSPRADAVLAAVHLAPIDWHGWRPISLAPAATSYALGLVLTALAVFRTTRRLCGAGMTRRLVRFVACAGFVAAGIALVLQAGGDRTLIYGRWPALDAGARPFGPFVNRNHFATWMLMAVPLAAGYVAASLAAARRPGPGVAARVAAVLAWPGASGAWVGAAALVMVLALLVSTSRSGIVAGGLSLAGGVWIARGRFTRVGVALAGVAVLVTAAFVAAYFDPAPLLSRVEETIEVGAGGRLVIWHETMRVVRDFWVTGTGLGGYQTAMLVYQRGDLGMFINQAHNQYLHLLAEGGVAVAGLAAAAAVAFVRLFLVRLAEDQSPAVWLRIGSATALVAVGVQGVWETGLRMPANGVLFMIAAAIAVHRPDDTPPA